MSQLSQLHWNLSWSCLTTVHARTQYNGCNYRFLLRLFTRFKQIDCLFLWHCNWQSENGPSPGSITCCAPVCPRMRLTQGVLKESRSGLPRGAKLSENGGSFVVRLCSNWSGGEWSECWLTAPLKKVCSQKAKYWGDFISTAGWRGANSQQFVCFITWLAYLSFPAEKLKADLWCAIKFGSPLQRSEKQSNKNRRNQWAGGRVTPPTATAATSNGFLLF